jgi:hypothetical protein
MLVGPIDRQGCQLFLCHFLASLADRSRSGVTINGFDFAPSTLETGSFTGILTEP